MKHLFDYLWNFNRKICGFSSCFYAVICHNLAYLTLDLLNVFFSLELITMLIESPHIYVRYFLCFYVSIVFLQS